MNTDALLSTATGEIERLHVFFVDWFSAAVDGDEETLKCGLLDRLDDEFTLIAPSGKLLKVEALANGLRAAHGSNPAFRIAIRNVRVRIADNGLMLATYEEWQRNARASIPADNGRISSVVFRRTGDELCWLHVHETWLPEEVMKVGRYDF